MKKEATCKFLLGDWVETIIDKITFGRGSMWAYTIAVRWLGFKSRYCEERRIWLNRLSCKSYKDEL